MWILLVLAALGFTLTFFVEASYAARAQKVQIVRIDKSAHNLLGPVTFDVGEPQDLIVGDSSAFLKNKTAVGYPMLDEDYLKLSGNSTIPLRTIEAVAGFARFGCILSAILAGTGLAILSRVRNFIMPPPA